MLCRSMIMAKGVGDANSLLGAPAGAAAAALVLTRSARCGSSGLVSTNGPRGTPRENELSEEGVSEASAAAPRSLGYGCTRLPDFERGASRVGIADGRAKLSIHQSGWMCVYSTCLQEAG